jgi:fatty-acyl-CoA synthase
MLPGRAPDRAGVERTVLAVISALVRDLRGDHAVEVSADASIDRDLGIGSLERIELSLRLEQSFGVHLPDVLIAEAERPSDLVAAILLADGSPAEPPGLQSLRAGPSSAVPLLAGTLTEVLDWHADRAADRVQVVLCGEALEPHSITYGTLRERAFAMAAGLRNRGLARGESVALMLRTEEAFFPAFLGCLVAGCVPVPLYPPFRADRIEEYAHRQSAILENSEARALVTFGRAERMAGLLRGRAPLLNTVVTVESLALGNGEVSRHRPGPNDAALIQYTSGSTGDPKGVLLTHENLLANIRAFGEALAIGPDDVAVSWLPLYHDMGLIGSWLGAFYFGVPVVIMSPLAFLSRPSRWLQAIHTYAGTISAAPNFAYDVCASKIPDEDLEGLDLSHWRAALNGSEMVSAESIERFVRRMEPHGFRRQAMTPVYGLAECAVGLAFPPLNRGPRVDCIERDAFQQAREIRCAAAGTQHPLRFVSCGQPLPGHEVRIADDSDRAVGLRIEGHVQFRGPSMMQGYFRNREATEAVRRNGWIDSGDLGYQADGELFITGRRKDMIIQAGRNVYPQEVEEVAATVPGIRQGCVAAFGVFDERVGTERLVVVAETRETRPESRARLRDSVMSTVAAALGTLPDVVVIVRPGAVLKTSSGKIRRAATRDLFAAGQLGRHKPSGLQWAGLVLEAGVARAAVLGADLGRVAFTGYVGTVMVLTLPWLWLALAVTRDDRRADRLIKTWSRLALAVTGLSPIVTGTERLDGAGLAVLVSNHASYIDALILMAALDIDFRFVAKRDLEEQPLLGLALRRAGHVLVDNAKWSTKLAGAEQATEALRSGRSLAWFAEGTFVRARGLLPFRLGAFRAAAETGRPVVPVSIKGTRDVLPDGTWLLKRSPIAVTIGSPITPHGNGWTEIVRLRDCARDEIARASGEEPA